MAVLKLRGLAPFPVQESADYIEATAKNVTDDNVVGFVHLTADDPLAADTVQIRVNADAIDLVTDDLVVPIDEVLRGGATRS